MEDAVGGTVVVDHQPSDGVVRDSEHGDRLSRRCPGFRIDVEWCLRIRGKRDVDSDEPQVADHEAVIRSAGMQAERKAEILGVGQIRQGKLGFVGEHLPLLSRVRDIADLIEIDRGTQRRRNRDRASDIQKALDDQVVGDGLIGPRDISSEQQSHARQQARPR